MDIVLGVLLGFIIGYILGRWTVDDLGTINRSRSSKKQERLAKLLSKLEREGSMDNSDAQELLNVSPKTAQNYFNELESQGIVEQHGKTGRSVFYSLKR